MWSFKQSLLEDLMQGAKNVFPKEFFALLSINSNQKLVEEFVVVPAIFGEKHAVFRQDLIPFDSKIVGSMHSHPSQNCNPSIADVNAFSKFGKIHLIACFPFSLDCIKAFDKSGRQVRFKVVE